VWFENFKKKKDTNNQYWWSKKMIPSLKNCTVSKRIGIITEDEIRNLQLQYDLVIFINI
jgi:hypothetical protein